MADQISRIHFQRFYESWFEELNRLLHELRSARKHTTTKEERQQLESHVQNLISHYASYYTVKSTAIERDVLKLLVSPWSSSLERSLQWIFGWRSTTLFHLTYAESSIQFEHQIVDILRGSRNGDLSDLTDNQFRQMSGLQCETVEEENSISNELSELQEDGPIELFKTSGGLNEKIRQLEGIILKADSVRMRTINRMVKLLTLQQTAELMIAAGELQLGVHVWGKDLDNKRGRF